MEEKFELITKITKIFKDENLEELEIESKEGEESFKIILKKNYQTNEKVVFIPNTQINKEETGNRITEEVENIEIENVETKEEIENGLVIKAPISGNFYLTPFPGAEPFIQEGQEIKKGQVVCIIESMKVLNEIESPYSGIVKKILVENSKFVKEGDPLILVK